MSEYRLSHTAAQIDEKLRRVDELTKDLTIPVTYSELKALRDSASLVGGLYYRITDYVTYSTQANTQSAQHPFDIIVRALNESELDEMAKAAQHAGDEYFANNSLGGWQLWYTMDNDTSRFAWADAENGKGVIFRMIDEYGNDCPYDFKNIQMQNALNTSNTSYYYTFDTNGSDLSLDGLQCYDNVIRKYVDGAQQINRIIFISGTHKNINNNYFDVKCYNNTFEGGCRNLHFERECYGNKFGYGCGTCNFETKFRNNTVGGEVQSINVGKGCSNNYFSANIYYCRFGNYFSNNYVCKMLYYSEFGHYVQNVIMGETSDSLMNGARYLTFENNVTCVNLYKAADVTGRMENIRVCSGTNGTSSARIMIEVPESQQTHPITYAEDSNGTLQRYCVGDLAALLNSTYSTVEGE